MFTLDASVWLNADSPNEPGHAVSRELIDLLLAQGSIIVEPTLLPVEVAGAISRVRQDERLAQVMATALLGLPGIRWVPVDEPVAHHASNLAAKHRLRGADAIYAMVALLEDCNLVSLDQEHLKRLNTIVTAMTPAVALAKLKHGSKP